MTITDLEYDADLALAEPESGRLAIVDATGFPLTDWAPVIVWHSEPGVVNLLNDEVTLAVRRGGYPKHGTVRCECGEYPYGSGWPGGEFIAPGDIIVVIIRRRSA